MGMNGILKKIIIKNDISYLTSILSLIILVGTLVIYFYGPVFFNPNEYLFNNTGDSYKNYFTYEWHIQNDISFINYSGSNYPFGENHLYTDGFPLLSNVIKILPFLKPYSIGIFNFSMLLSLFVTAFLLFKIFKFFKLSNWQAVLSSIGVTTLCPQVLRYEGHFALSYGFCIPLVIYLLLKFNASNNYKFKQTVIIFLVSFCVFFIHPYLGMICSAFIILYWMIKQLYNFNKLNFFHFVTQGLLPLIIYFLIIKITDSHSDRNAKPYGFFYFVSSIETVFISTHQPFRHLLSQIYKITSQNGEGIAYVGISSLLVILLSPFILIRNRFYILQQLKHNSILKTYWFMFLSAFVLLLFSMGYPFKLGFEWLLDYVSMIQQFRSPGRFAWAFYFIVSIASCVIICRYLFLKQSVYLRNGLVLVLLLLFTIEGIPYHHSISKKQFPKNIFNEKLLDDEEKLIIRAIRKINPQAIIPLPFFHIGTDYYNISGSEKITNSSFVTSLHSKVPLMANLTPRNSLTEAEKLIQIISNDVLDKAIKKDIKSLAPFVLLYDKEELSEEETLLLKKGITLIETEHYILKTITFNQLFSNSSKSKKRYFDDHKSNMIFEKGCYLTDSTYFVYNTFDDLKNGKYQANVNDTNIIYEIIANKLKDHEVYEVSFWYTASERLDMNNQLVISEIDDKDNYKLIAQKNIYSMQNVYKGNTLAKITFECKNPKNKINISLNGISDREKIFFIDNLIVKQKNVDVYLFRKDKSIKDSLLIFNNFELVN